MKIEPADLTNITRRSKTAETKVYIINGTDKQLWLTFGEAQLDSESGCRLRAYLSDGVTDFEHDSAYALQLPLIGLRFDQLWYHTSCFTAWVDPNTDDFHVPRAGYNPMKLKDAYKCKARHCEKPHMMVPQGFYVPPFDAELYEAVKGKQLEILIGLKK